MPQYELMYLLGSQVADDQVPAISEQIKKFIGDFGGTDVRETLLGKKKLAYPIKKTRNGHYVVVDFVMEGNKVNELDARIRKTVAFLEGFTPGLRLTRTNAIMEGANFCACRPR